MNDLKICRICVATGTKMYRLESFYLKHYYEEITAAKINIGDNLPQYFCYECAMMLHKFHKFKEKCYSGQKVLMEILEQGMITYENVTKIDRSLRNIQPILQIITESKRIRHYNLIYYEDFYVKVKDEKDDIKVEFVDENSYYEHDPVAVDTMAIDAIAIDSTAIDTTAIAATVIDATAIAATVIDATAIADTVIDATAIETAEKNKVHQTIQPVKRKVITKLKKTRKKVNIDPFEKEGVYNSTNKGDIILSPDKWKKHKLTVQEAVKEFCARAHSSGYLDAGYKCTDCNKGFSKEDMLNRHIQLRHNKSFPFECSFCKMRFKRYGPRKIHMRQHFTKYQCLLCKFVCNRENSALLHVEYHSGVKKKCLHCGKLFRHSSTYYTHMRMSHRSEYICPICGASFVSESGLHQHKQLKHVTTDIDNPDDTDDNTYCDRCDIKFKTRKAYEVHLFHSALHTEQDVKDQAPPKVIRKKAQASKSSETDAPKRKRSKAKKERLRKKPTTCYQCGQHFATQSACMKHHQAEHPGTCFTPPALRHICELCGASLAPASIATHNNMHTREQLFSCEHCDKTFYNTAARNRHQLTHTGEKPFACSLCDKRFTQSNSVKLHYRTIHLKEPYPKRVRKKKS